MSALPSSVLRGSRRASPGAWSGDLGGTRHVVMRRSGESRGGCGRVIARIPRGRPFHLSLGGAIAGFGALGALGGIFGAVGAAIGLRMRPGRGPTELRNSGSPPLMLRFPAMRAIDDELAKAVEDSEADEASRPVVIPELRRFDGQARVVSWLFSPRCSWSAARFSLW